MIRKNSLILLSIILMAAVLRLWQLGNVPPSPDWDEAALGYNAYSIMQTGRDEYGKFLPIVLRSFDDYKPALYAYLTIPSIAIFGLSTFAVRFPSALFGILTVIATYFLVRELFKNDVSRHAEFSSASVALKKRILKQVQDDKVALLTALSLAISPWHIQFSRVAFESNVGLAFNVFSALFFLKALKKPWLLLLSAVFASLALYTYQSEKIFTPLLLISLILIYRQELWMVGKKYLVLAFLTGIIISFPLMNYTLTDAQALTRARGVSVFADQTSFLQKTSQRLLWDQENNDKLGIFLDNRRLQYGLAVVSGYLAHFDINWLFMIGDEPRHHAPGMGLLYLWELPAVLFGIYSLIFGGSAGRRTKYLVFAWFLIAPIPASITSAVPHAVRTLNFLPTFQIFAALGIMTSWNYAMSFPRKRESRFPAGSPIRSGMTKMIIFVTFSLFLFNFLYYLNQYFIQQNYFYSRSWQYGYQQAVEEVKNIEGRYRKIIVSNKPPLDQSYIFSLFYLKYDPTLYQREKGNSSGFSKYTFRPIGWSKELKSPKILYVGESGDFSEDAKIIKVIHFLNGAPAIKIVEG